MFSGIKTETVSTAVNTFLQELCCIILNLAVTCIEVRKTVKAVMCNIITV